MKRILSNICDIIFGKHSTNSFPRSWILLFDIFIVIVSFAVVIFMTYYNLEDKVFNFTESVLQSISLIIVYTTSFILFRSYVGLIRFSEFSDVKKLFSACTISVIVLLVSKWAFEFFSVDSLDIFFPDYTDIIYHCFFSLVLLILSRLIVRRLYVEIYRGGLINKQIGTIIYGAGDGGTITSKVIEQDPSSEYKVIAFIDDNPQKHGKNINGIPILSPDKALDKNYIDKHRIENIIIAIPSISSRKKEIIVDRCLKLGMKVKNVSQLNKWISGDFKSGQIEDIKIEDLLGRDPIIMSNEDITKEIGGKVVLVTGAAGSIGSEICRQVLYNNPSKLIMIDQAETPMYDLQFELKNTSNFKSIIDRMIFEVANVKDRKRMERIFAKYQPQLVYHAAAYKHVPFMEEFPYESIAVNVFGTKNIVDLADQFNVEEFVMISTDKAVNPTNVMGATKRIAEIYSQSRRSNTRFITTRFGNVLGSNGSVIPLFKKQLAQGGPLTVTDKRITRYFMTISEATSLVLEASSIGETDEIFVFDMGEPVKIYDLAKKMIELSHIPNIQIVEIGLRQGEKLYEEVLSDKENTTPTSHKKIMIAKVDQKDADSVDKQISELYNLMNEGNNFAIVSKMKEIVPEFLSNNSPYCSLDRNRK